VPSVIREAKIVNKYGLHARPAMKFVELANSYASKVEVSNGVLTVDAKSIMSVMRLAAVQGTTLTITADGHDAKAAAAALAKLVEEGFGEMGDTENFQSIET
jgi:phosphocarrier protein HPr